MYTHRNGETDNPTVAGWYWVEERWDDRKERLLAHIVQGDQDFPRLWVLFHDGRWDILAHITRCAWWGPVPLPWPDETADANE